MKRLFLAIKILPTDNFMDVYSSLKNELKHEKIKWVEPYNLHLTLKFFGETEDEKIDSIIEKISESVSRTEQFSFEVEEIGIFGSSYNPKVLWAGISGSKNIINLENLISEGLSEIGYVKDRQNFVPHLTLGRIKYLSDKTLFQLIVDDYKNEYFQEQKIGELYLFESILKKEGPQYSIVKSFHLK